MRVNARTLYLQLVDSFSLLLACSVQWEMTNAKMVRNQCACEGGGQREQSAYRRQETGGGERARGTRDGSSSGSGRKGSLSISAGQAAG